MHTAAEVVGLRDSRLQREGVVFKRPWEHREEYKTTETAAFDPRAEQHVYRLGRQAANQRYQLHCDAYDTSTVHLNMTPAGVYYRK